MANAKNNKSSKPLSKKILSFVSVSLMLAVIGFFGTKSVKEIVATYQLKQELKSVQSELETLNAEKASLTLEKERLNDPTYVENYARGTHLLSKDDEQVFILPKAKP